jgi:hypothetical protein
MVYQDATCTEWERRGFADTCREKTLAVLAIPSLLSRENLRVPVIDELLAYEAGQTPPPPWLGREDIHESHRSNLLRKDPEFYGELFPDTPADLDYVWPVPKEVP